jgi:biotin carboxylase
MPSFASVTLANASGSGKAVVLVDPLSTGVMVEASLFNSGYEVILLWSDRSQPVERAKHEAKRGTDAYAAIVVHAENELSATLDALVAAFKTTGTTCHAVVNGSEFGVLLEDDVANGLNERLGTTHLKASGMPDSKLKVNKWLQAEAVRKSGLDSVRQVLAYTEEDVSAFLATQTDGPVKVVAKPNSGAGSVGVTLCESVAAVWDAFYAIQAGEHKATAAYKNRYRQERHAVLLQEFLVGAEYIITVVVKDGESKCTAVWKYDKRPYNGSGFVCFSKELMGLDDEPHLRNMVEYTNGVLKAIGFQSGAVHAEVMQTARGPILVEANCRLHGGGGAWVAGVEHCIGYSQLSAFLDCYLNNGANFAALPSVPPGVIAGGCQQVKMRTRVGGILKEVDQAQLHRMTSLASYNQHSFSAKVGAQLYLTVDMPTVPGEITLVSSDKDLLEREYQLVNEILGEGIFIVEPEVLPMDDQQVVNLTLSVEAAKMLSETAVAVTPDGSVCSAGTEMASLAAVSDSSSVGSESPEMRGLDCAELWGDETRRLFIGGGAIA